MSTILAGPYGQALATTAFAVAAYLIGGIPWSLLIGRWVAGIDLRTVGSGNLGATNVARTLGGRWGVTVFFLDFAKGAVPVLACALTSPMAWHDASLPFVAIAAFMGHLYSPYIGFKGGKGIATAAGAVTMMNPLVVPAEFVLFFAVALTTRYVSAGSIAIAVGYPITVFFLYPGRRVNLVFSFIVAAFVIWRHRANIGRIIRGEESKASWGIFKDKDVEAESPDDTDTEADDPASDEGEG
jgi:glycerol-3-phosphate acyltransferase PlsY